MIKLVAAKCPSCGANIEVDENSKNTACEYCGSTILVQEAIQRVKVEHSGTVNVSSVQDETKNLEIAKKYLENYNFLEARALLDKILGNDPFNLEALKMVVEYDTAQLFNEYRANFESVGEDILKVHQLIDIYIKNSEKIRTIGRFDVDKQYVDFTSEFSEKLDEVYKSLNVKLKEVSAIIDGKAALRKACNDYVQYDSPTDKVEQRRINKVLSHFKLNELNIDQLYNQKGMSAEEKVNLINSFFEQEKNDRTRKKKLIQVLSVVIVLAIAIEEVMVLGVSIVNIIIGGVLGFVVSAIVTGILRKVLLER